MEKASIGWDFMQHHFHRFKIERTKQRRLNRWQNIRNKCE